MRVKLSRELGRHRLAAYALADLDRLVDAIRPEVADRAARADDEELLELGALLAERHPPQSYAEDTTPSAAEATA